MERIRRMIRCKKCNNVLNLPIVLPCGTTVCQKHVYEEKNKVFTCVGCENDHVIPENGFSPNLTIQEIIDARLDELDPGEDYNQAMKSCKQLESIIDEIELLKRDPRFYIDETIADLKRKIDLKREILKKEIDDEANKLILDLENHKKTCELFISTNDISESTIVKDCWPVLIKSKSELAEWMNVLNILRTDNAKWKSICEKSQLLAQYLETKSDVMKQELTMNQLDEFQMKQNQFEMIKIMHA